MKVLNEVGGLSIGESGRLSIDDAMGDGLQSRSETKNDIQHNEDRAAQVSPWDQ